MSEDRDPLRDLTLESFGKHLGETFRIALVDGEIELELTEAEPLGKSGGEDRGRTPFSLVFRGGPPGRYLPQGTYPLIHDDLGTLPIFLVPIGADEGTTRYQAIFT